MFSVGLRRLSHLPKLCIVSSRSLVYCTTGYSRKQWNPQYGKLLSDFIPNRSCYSEFRTYSFSRNEQDGGENMNTSKEERVEDNRKGGTFDRTTYKVVYKMPHMQVLSAISRLKILQVGLMVALTGPLCFSYSQGNLEFGTLAVAVGGCLGTSAVLFIMSYYFRKVLGELRYYKDEDSLIISHLTFWERQDHEMSIEEVVPWSDGTSHLNPTKLVQTLEIYDSKNVFYYSLKYGRVVDKELFEYVLGFPLQDSINAESGDKVETIEETVKKSDEASDRKSE